LDSRYRQVLGKSAEDLACEELTRRGYVILERRYRTRLGEIDIIARDGGTLVFVEVKARVGDEFGAPEDAITPQKQWRMTRMAETYLMMQRLGDAVDCRFDVVAVDAASDPAAVTVYQSAFDAV
jgi:putative endonuclease